MERGDDGGQKQRYDREESDAQWLITWRISGSETWHNMSSQKSVCWSKSGHGVWDQSSVDHTLVSFHWHDQVLIMLWLVSSRPIKCWPWNGQFSSDWQTYVMLTFADHKMINALSTWGVWSAADLTLITHHQSDEPDHSLTFLLMLTVILSGIVKHWCKVQGTSDCVQVCYFHCRAVTCFSYLCLLPPPYHWAASGWLDVCVGGWRQLGHFHHQPTLSAGGSHGIVGWQWQHFALLSRYCIAILSSSGVPIKLRWIITRWFKTSRPPHPPCEYGTKGNYSISLLELVGHYFVWHIWVLRCWSTMHYTIHLL